MDVCLKRPKINEKEAGVGPFILKKEKNIFGTNALKLFCRKICCRKLQLQSKNDYNFITTLQHKFTIKKSL